MKYRPHFRLTFQGYGTTMPGDNILTDIQAQTGPLTFWLGRKERCKDLFLSLGCIIRNGHPELIQGVRLK